MSFWILEDKKPVRVHNRITWTKWFDKIENCRVANTEVGEVSISTVFLGISHSLPNDSPILFETMIFGGEHNGFQNRYRTYAGAEYGHSKAVQVVLESIDNDK